MKEKVYCIFVYLLLAPIALLLLVSNDTHASTEEMTVEDAIKLGLKNNYDIQIARHTAEIAINNKGKGIANFLPVIDTNSDFRYDDSNEETGSPTRFGNASTRSLNSQLSLSWTLFDGFGMFADKTRYDELARSGEYQARDTIERTVVSIMEAFFNLVQQEQLLDVVYDTRDISKRRLEREEVRRDLGGASSTDLLNARVNFNNDESVLLDQQLAVTIAHKDLNITLARDPLTPVVVKKEIVIPPFDSEFDELLMSARERNSTLLTASYNKKAADENVRIAKSAFWPRLVLNSSYGYTDRALRGEEVMISTDKNSHSIESGVGLMLSFNLFNGNVDKINYQNARLEALNQDLTVKNIENEIAGLVQEKYTTFQKRMAKVRLEEENTGTARQNLELQKERYATGASDSLDFRDAQVNYARAQVRLIVARYDARISLLEIQQLIGKLKIE
ncbi:MAG: TolC family protein [Deltaproteobacteria bacterium]|nr:TolC family protein [Deltaproteobacteria bacterium]